MEVAQSIVDEERRKHHSILANELLRILDNGVVAASPILQGTIQPPPRDHERNTPLLEVRQPYRYLHDMVLDQVTQEVIFKVIREFKEWDVLEASGLWPSCKLLFCGPPGCGKTVSAEVIASELGLPLVYVRFDSVVSSLLGETASNLRKVFEYISQDIWVVLFDEFDAIGRSRDDVTEHGEIKRVVNSFLQMLDNTKARSLIIAATNYEQVLDPALWRRFDEIVRFERPTELQIDELLKKRLTLVRNPNVSINQYIKHLKGYTFGDVERIALDIRKYCALDGRSKMNTRDLEIALENQKHRKQAMQQAFSIEHPKVDLP